MHINNTSQSKTGKESVKETPILFGADMVRAILTGTKRQTRRIIKPSSQPRVVPLEVMPWIVNGSRQTDDNGSPCWKGIHPDYPTGEKWFSCPYGKVGDILWVREQMLVTGFVSGGQGTETAITVKYCADGASSGILPYPSRLKGKPQVGKKLAYGGYREASRIALKITDVRVERIQSISPTDCQAEGIAVYQAETLIPAGSEKLADAIYLDQFVRLWESVNGSRDMGWSVNPWCWVIEFEVLA